MVMRNPKKKTRNILVYFIESTLWKNYKSKITDNRLYWIENDPLRATRMYNAQFDYKSYPKSKGYSVRELIYDMIDCVHSSTLKPRTKTELYRSMDELEEFHDKLNTIDEDVYEDYA